MTVKTGISGLDRLLGGGVPDDSIVLVSGSTGTGKTIISLQFLYEGLQQKERALFVTFEQGKEKIFQQCALFGWDFEAYEKQGLLTVVTIDDVDLGSILQRLRKTITEFKPRRLVVDSITFMSLSAYSVKRLVDLDKTTMAELYETGPHQSSPEFDSLIVRKLLIDFVKVLQKNQINAILTSEIPRESQWLSRDTFSEYACDGVILLKSVSMGTDLHRTLEVVKMRNTKIKGGIYSFDFKKDGVKLNV